MRKSGLLKTIACTVLTGFYTLNCLAQEDWANFKAYEQKNRQQIENHDFNPPKVVFLGNSITELWNDYHPEFFNNNGFAGRGISGQTTYQMLLRFREDVINLSPEYVVIEGGINDIAQNNHTYDEERTFGNILSMTQLADAAGIKVILCSLLPAGEIYWNKDIPDVAAKVASLNKRIKNLAEEKGYPYADYYTPMADSDNALDSRYTKDGIHPLPQGYEIMETVILNALNPQ